jgi:tape measure domain-containing protein
MVTEVERMSVVFEASVKRFENTINRQNSQFKKTMKEIEQSASKMEASVANSFAGLGKRMGAAFAGISAGVILNDLRKTADEYTRIMNSLSVAGVSNANMSSTFDQLFASAQRNAVPLETLAQLYGRVSQAQSTLKASSAEIMQVTDIVAQSLRVSGQSAESAQGALLQLAQAFSNGKVQAEEYNSLLDGAYPLLQAAAAGLKETGGDVAKLTALVKDGKVSSEAFFRAIQAGAPLLQDKLAGATLTSAQAMTQLQNELIKAVGEFDKATGASAALAGGINSLAGSIAGIGQAATNAVLGVQALVNKVGELAKANAGAQRAQALTYQEERAQRTAAAREMALGNSGGRAAVASERATADAAATAALRKATADFRASEIDFANKQVTAPLPPSRPGGVAGGGIKPVSLADFAVPGGDDKAAGAASKEKLDSYEKELVAIGKRTAALNLEAESVGKSTFERAKAVAALDLETAAKKANIPVTEEMRRKIDEASTGYANAKVRVEEVTKALEAAQDAQKFFGDAAADALEDIIINGEKAEDVVKNLAKSLAKAALQAALMGSGPLAGIFGTGGTGGNAGGIFGMLGGLFKPTVAAASGGYISGPGSGRSDSIPARLSNGEYVVNAAATKKNRALLEAINSGQGLALASGGYVGPPSIPRGIRGGGGPAKIIVNNTVSDQVQATPQQSPNGDLTVMISAIEARIADNVVRGQGALAPALSARQTGRHLRG